MDRCTMIIDADVGGDGSMDARINALVDAWTGRMAAGGMENGCTTAWPLG